MITIIWLSRSIPSFSLAIASSKILIFAFLFLISVESASLSYCSASSEVTGSIFSNYWLTHVSRELLWGFSFGTLNRPLIFFFHFFHGACTQSGIPPRVAGEKV